MCGFFIYARLESVLGRAKTVKWCTGGGGFPEAILFVGTPVLDGCPSQAVSILYRSWVVKVCSCSVEIGIVTIGGVVMVAEAERGEH